MEEKANSPSKLICYGKVLITVKNMVLVIRKTIIRNRSGGCGVLPRCPLRTESLIPPAAGSMTCCRVKAESLSKLPQSQMQLLCPKFCPLLGSSSHPKTSQYRVLRLLIFNIDGTTPKGSQVQIPLCSWLTPSLRWHSLCPILLSTLLFPTVGQRENTQLFPGTLNAHTSHSPQGIPGNLFQM